MHAAKNKDYQEGYQACVAYLYEQYREENMLSDSITQDYVECLKKDKKRTLPKIN